MIVRNSWHWSFFFTSDTVQTLQYTFHGQNVINSYSRPKDVGMIRKSNTSLHQVFWSYSKKSKALKIYLDSFFFFCSSCITALLAKLCPTRQWFPHSHPCPASIPILFNPSYGSKAMPKCQSRVKNLQSHREIVQFTLLVWPGVTAWGGSGCSDASWSLCISGLCSRNTQLG